MTKLNKTIRFVIFDLDGTLVDSRADIASGINHGIETVGGETRQLDEIVPFIGRPLEDIFEAFLPTSLAGRVQEASEVYRKFYYEHCADQSVLYDGTEDCLKALAELPLAIATTKMTFQAIRVIEAFGLAKYFRAVFGCDDIPHKPDPAVIHLVLESLGVSAEDGLMVGDTHFDIEAGRAAGMATCGVTFGIGGRRQVLDAGADVVVDTLRDLPALIGVEHV